MVEKEGENEEKAPAEEEKETESEDDINENDLDDSQFDDPPDFVDELTEKDVAIQNNLVKPSMKSLCDSILVIDNVPEVGPDKLEKLRNVILRIFSRFGQISKHYFPTDADGKTKGYVLLEFSSKADAIKACKATDNYPLDKHHVFAVNMVTDFDKYSVSPKLQHLEPMPFVEEENLRLWLQDPDCIDQYAMQYGSYTAVYWNHMRSPTCIIERENWTETATVKWTPKGTYLATCHDKGVLLWGGKEFDRKKRFSHTSAKHIGFSPCERYLVSFSPEFLEQKEGDDQTEPIIIWDIRSGKKKRGFSCESEAITWPIIKWSYDGKYFARIIRAGLEDASIGIYDAETCGLLDKKSIKIPCLKDFSWSPGDHILGFWVPEVKDIPARVTLMEIPSRKEIRSKNLFSVADCKMQWQSKGDYFCVQVSRVKNKKISSCNFEVFHLRKKLIPVDNIELKDTVVDYGIEPGGSKLVVIHGEGLRSSASFYSLEDPKGQLTCLRTFEKIQANTVSWSPNGRFVVLAQLRTSSDGILEFYDSSEMTLMGTPEHYKVTDIEWDPTGRYLITGVSSWAVKMDTGYNLWSFQGKCLRQEQIDNFGIILWRPRPPSLLSADEISHIKKDLKKYQRKFDIKDRMSQSKVSKELVESRRKLMKDFKSYREKKSITFENEKQQRINLRNDIDIDTLSDDDVVDEIIEVLIKEELFPIDD